MPRKLDSGNIINALILSEVRQGRGQNLAARIVEQFGITRQAVSRHLRRLVADGTLQASGNTRSRTYSFAVKEVLKSYLVAGLEEHAVWDRDVRPLLADVRGNVLTMCEYGFTEILNNAIDHSESVDVLVVVSRSVATIEMRVIDNGVGIFRKIREARALESEREAILELTKGKVTTDPEHHSGEGIFFTSRMMDSFHILSRALALGHNREKNDWLYEDAEDPVSGTSVVMKIDPQSDHTDTEVWERYRASQDDYAFARTNVMLALATAEGGSLISRSQAKRVMAGLDRFRDAHLIFTGVATIGPAFADEIFRVWKNAHPDTNVTYSGASDEVEKMIARTQTPT
jgi:anti-sigma regulatory factor (Ser/Thr protein kinase)